MPDVKKIYSLAEAEAAVNRSNGQPLAQGVGDPRNRTYNNTGKKRGHEYMHRGPIAKYEFRGDHPSGENPQLSGLEKNVLKKSRTEDRRTSYRLVQALLNSPAGQTALGELDAGGDNPPGQKWLPAIDVLAEDLYGYESDGTVVKKISKARINFRKINGSLFIASVYPTEFQGERDYDLGDFFELVMNA